MESTLLTINQLVLCFDSLAADGCDAKQFESERGEGVSYEQLLGGGGKWVTWEEIENLDSKGAAWLMYMVTRMVAEQVLLTARSKLLVVEAYTETEL